MASSKVNCTFPKNRSPNRLIDNFKMKEETTDNTGFYELFEPTADLLFDCVYENQGSEISVILQSMMLLEAAANCCLFKLKINRKLESELDRLPVFAKFDTYLLIKSSGKHSLDRGASACQDMHELIGLRNRIVHPKRFKTNWLIEEGEHESGTGSYEKTERLKLATSCVGWLAEDSITVFRAVNNFIIYFFVETCGLSYQETRLLLLTTGDDGTEDIWVDSVRLQQLQRDLSIPLHIWGVDED